MIITVASYEGGLGKRSRLRGSTGCHQPGRRTGTATHIVLPLKSEPPRGKRSTQGWRQKAVLLKEESIKRAT